MPKHLIAIEKVATLPTVTDYVHGYPVHNQADGLIYTANLEAATPAWEPAGVATANPDAVTIAASGATPSLDLSQGSGFDVTLDQDATFTIDNAEAGKLYEVLLVLRQDATGGRTATLPVRWAGGAAPTLTATANAVDVFKFASLDGSTWFEVARQLDVKQVGGGAVIPDVSGAAYSGTSASTAGVDSILTAMWFSPDGTMVFFGCNSLDVGIKRWDLATAWDVTSASLNANTLGITGNTYGVYLSDDGAHLLAAMANEEVRHYTLSTPFDLSTAAFQQAFTVPLDGNAGLDIRGVAISPDGTKMYVSDYYMDQIREYTLSTAWDVSTAGSKVEYQLPAFPKPNGMWFASDGSAFFLADDDTNSILRFDLSTPWDISTAAAGTGSPSVGTEDGTPVDVSFKADGTQMFVLGQFSDAVYVYNL